MNLKSRVERIENRPDANVGPVCLHLPLLILEQGKAPSDTLTCFCGAPRFRVIIGQVELPVED